MSASQVHVVCLTLATFAWCVPASGQCSFGFTGRSYPAGQSPGDLAFADLDLDGTPDLLVGTEDGLGVRFGLVAKGFGPALLLPTGSQTARTAAGDFSGDGIVDVITSSATGPELSVLPGDGFGGFLPWSKVCLTGLPGALAAGHLDHDAIRDLLVLQQGERQLVSLLFKAMPGPPQIQATGLNGAPLDLAIADLNTDGSDDAIVTESSPTALHALLGNGSGGFSTSAEIAQAGNAWWLTPIDANRDGHIDVAVAGALPAGGVIRIFHGDGTGGLARQTASPTLDDIRGLSAADLDGDGTPELLVRGSPGTRTLAIHRQSGTIWPSAQVLDLPDANGLAVADVAGDAAPELLVSRASGDVIVLEATAMGRLRDLPSLGADLLAPGVVATTTADVDQDGHPEILVASGALAAPGVRVLYVSGGDLLAGALVTSGATGGDLTLIASGDLDGDANCDLVVGLGANGYEVFRGDGAGGFSPLGAGQEPLDGPAALVDTDLDGNLDLVAGYFGGVALLYGNGQGGFSAPGVLGPPVMLEEFLVDDVDQDGTADLIGTLAGRGYFMRGPLATGTFATLPRGDFHGFATGDLDGDGNKDLIGLDPDANLLVFPLETTGFGTPQTFALAPSQDPPLRVAAADCDGDGAFDVILRHSHSMSFLRGDGQLQLTATGGSYALPEGDALLLADFDQDGLQDVVTGAAFPTLSLNRQPTGYAFFYGQGKPGAAGLPTLTTIGTLASGTTVTLRVDHGTAGLLPILLVGAAPASEPFDQGSLLVGAPFAMLLPAFNTQGASSLTAAIPDANPWCGLQLYFQAMFVDPIAAGGHHTAQTAGMGWVVGP